MSKIRIAVLFGGRSGEHDVSVRSAASVLQALDREKYEVIPIAITREGRWLSPTESSRLLPAEAQGALSTAAAVVVSREPGSTSGADVVFPVLHGTFGEDGTVQGLLELANVAYVGAGVLASAAAMDKDVMKRLFRERRLAAVDYVAFLRDKRAEMVSEVEQRFGYPMFVKPANLGSSVGISKARSAADFAAAMELALQFDRKVVIEAAVPNAREIECAVLGNDSPETSIPGEAIPSREFYDYEAKYLDEGLRLLIPAPLADTHVAEIRRMAIGAFRAVDGAGMSRVDFLVASDTGETFVNELNTIPGFTPVSMYPKLWEASGLPYPALLDRLIALALERHAAKQRLRTSMT